MAKTNYKLYRVNTLAGYKYTGLPLTPSLIEELILQVFNNRTIKRDVIVSQIRQYHLDNGGVLNGTNLTHSVKKALNTLSKNKKGINRGYGQWYITNNEIDDKPISFEVENLDSNLQLSAVEAIQSPIATNICEDFYGASIYLYYYETYEKLSQLEDRNIWPCKIGMSSTDSLSRILTQVGTSFPERPIIALIIKTEKANQLEQMLHSILNFKGRKVENSPGKEWFYTSPNEISNLLNSLFPELQVTDLRNIEIS